MGTTTDDCSEAGAEFTFEGDLATARDLESGVAASGTSKAEALTMPGEALELHEDCGDPIEDGDAFFLRSE